MSSDLSKESFTEASWLLPEVQGFRCGDKPYQKEVSDWLKAPREEKSSALASISDKKKPGRVWLYRLPDGALVGFGALAETNWRWQGVEDPRLPVTIVIWYAVQEVFKKKPEGPREDHYSFQIFESLVAEAGTRRDTHPIMGLYVSTANREAIALYEDFGFTTDGFTIGDEADSAYQQMYVILNRSVFALMYEEAIVKRRK